MIEAAILKDSTELTQDQQKQLLGLHYAFLNYQRTTLDVKLDVPELAISTLFRGNRIAVALVAGRVIGYCIYRVISGVLKLRTLYVAEEYRRSGTMTALIELINSREVYANAQLTIHQKCRPAYNLFTRLGYVASELDGWLNLFFDKHASLANNKTTQSVVV
ncbi:hypothetical protein pEaSNUABM6_00204 [Erwinia phage pEa_SNUABM_6]|nr:hypothetical protein pEaSNUABM6_00204 [Erwinia phage pEa_SNUABM_6]